MSSDTRPPQMVRERRSRPPSSVPNRLCAVIPPLGGPCSVWFGSAMGSRGARAQTTMTSTTHATAIQNPGPRRLRSRTGLASAPGAGTVGAAATVPSARTSGWTDTSHPGVEQDIERVDEEVDDDVGRGDEEHDGLHDEVVLAEDGVDHRFAD